MDRFVWTSGLLEINETLVIQQRGVRVYDGEEKDSSPGLYSGHGSPCWVMTLTMWTLTCHVIGLKACAAD
ncbi:hypothetical protein STEG23_009582 [Scotinomys teguina]